MNWVKLAERKLQPFQSVLIRYDAGPGGHHLIQYVVAWYSDKHWRSEEDGEILPRHKYVTHWAKIEPPIDVLVDVME